MIRTENNALTYELKNDCLHLFSKIGAMRNWTKADKIQMFQCAAKEDPTIATKILFWGRDARNGAGERLTFHEIADTCIDTDFIARNAKVLINLGYAKDLLPYMGNEKVLSEWAMILKGDSDGVRRDLVAKWTPRKGPIFKAIRNRMALTNKEFRHLLVTASTTVEQEMAKKDWSDIKYSSVPGAAMRKYSKAFQKHDPVRFMEWKTDKDAKASVSATYPHDVTKLACKTGDWILAQKLWDNLPQLTGAVNPLIMADTSGSMSGLPMEVAVSLGIFCSEQLPGPFQGKVMTFSSDPRFHELNQFDTLENKWEYLWAHDDWGGSTNFSKAYQLLLESAKFFNTPPEEMPQMIVCISDMQFNEAVDRWGSEVTDRPEHEVMKDSFLDAGYNFPKLVYWNVRASFGSPVDEVTENTALISGFNPAVIRPLLNGESMNPMKVMYDSLDHIDLDFTCNPLKKGVFI